MTAATPTRRAPGPLRGRRFALLFSGGLISETGDWLLIIALPLYVLSLTGSALITSVVFMLGLLPSLVCAPIAGVLADHYDKRTLMVGVSLAQAVLLLALLFVHDAGQLWIVYLVTAGEAGLAAVFEPAKNALVPTLVDIEQLVSANGLIGFTSSVGRLVGAPLGGVVLQVAGMPGVLIADLVSFVVVAGLLAAIPRQARSGPVAPRPRVTRQWVDGVREIGVPGLPRRIAGVLVLTSLAQGMFVALFVFYVLDVLGAGEAETGLLRGVQAIGGLAGGLLCGLIARAAGTRWSTTGGLLVFAVIGFVGWNLPAATTALWIYVGLFAVIGAPAVVSFAGLLSMLQGAVPGDRLGRAMGGLYAVSDGSQALGMLLAGLLLGPLPLGVLLNAQMGLYLVAALAVWLLPAAAAEP